MGNKISLHQNTGKWSWEWTFFKYFINITLAEDPSEKWWKRRWQQSTSDGCVQTHSFSVQHVKSPDDLSAWFVYLWMIQIAIAKM